MHPCAFPGAYAHFLCMPAYTTISSYSLSFIRIKRHLGGSKYRMGLTVNFQYTLAIYSTIIYIPSSRYERGLYRKRSRQFPLKLEKCTVDKRGIAANIYEAVYTYEREIASSGCLFIQEKKERENFLIKSSQDLLIKIVNPSSMCILQCSESFHHVCKEH